jgi:hypothetical protein
MDRLPSRSRGMSRQTRSRTPRRTHLPRSRAHRVPHRSGTCHPRHRRTPRRMCFPHSRDNRPRRTRDTGRLSHRRLLRHTYRPCNKADPPSHTSGTCHRAHSRTTLHRYRRRSRDGRDTRTTGTCRLRCRCEQRWSCQPQAWHFPSEPQTRCSSLQALPSRQGPPSSPGSALQPASRVRASRPISGLRISLLPSPSGLPEDERHRTLK